MKEFFAPGKLLLSGEYSVLEGAQAVAVPTFKGQHLKAEALNLDDLHYQAFDENGESWLDFLLSKAQSDAEILVQKIMHSALAEEKRKGWSIQTKLDFPRAWGFGSSSTFISLIADWAETDVWPLFFENLKGSGYDVAVAQTGKCISYQLKSAHTPHWNPVQLPGFLGDTWLLYLGNKQNSAREVNRYLSTKRPENLIAEISELSRLLPSISDIQSLEEWMNEHEAKTAQLISRSRINRNNLPPFEGAVKSLGAWGGDFVWISRLENPENFKKLGFNDFYRFSELVDF